MVTEIQEKLISKAIRYLKKLEGTPRKNYCKNKAPTKDGEPFWIENTKPPSIEYIKKKGAVCVGLGNLVRRYMGLEVPGNITGKKKHFWPGGTESWFKYLKKEKRLEKIDFEKVYPKGTLLIQPFNPKDQGHIAITINSSKKGLLYSKIIHNVHDKGLFGTYIHKVIEYPNYKRHTHVCLPKNWLLKN